MAFERGFGCGEPRLLHAIEIERANLENLDVIFVVENAIRDLTGRQSSVARARRSQHLDRAHGLQIVFERPGERLEDEAARRLLAFDNQGPQRTHR